MKKSGAKPAEMTLHREIQRLAEAMMNGRLDERGDPAQFTGDDAALVLMVNRMLDTLVTPLRLAAGAIDEIAHGRIPPFVIDDYTGEYNNLKRNLNTLLATLYGLHSETQHLIGNIVEHLAGAQKRIQLRQCAIFFKAHPDYGASVAAGLGLSLDEVKTLAAMSQEERAQATAE